MSFDPSKPYNDLPNLPPTVEIETKMVLKACVSARVALAALRQATALIPNPAVLINTIPLLEAQASSEIENIVTTTDALFRYAQLKGPAPDPATKEALRYRTALRAGFDSLQKRPLTTRTADEVCSTIKGVRMSVRKVPGTKLASDATGEVIYTPPEVESRLRDKLANWERFVHDQRDIDPVVRMAVAHYQFEAIHPFTDGNGRTGRILNLLMLVEQGVLDVGRSHVDVQARAKDLGAARLDVVIGSIAVSAVAFFIILTCAATLFKAGIQVEKAEEAALALRPLAGSYCTWLFAFGLFNASMFAAAILPLSTSYTVCEAFGWESSLDKKFSEAPQFYGLYCFIIFFSGSIILIPSAPLVTIMFVSQVINGLVLPAVLFFMLLLINDARVMREHKNGPVLNVICWVTVLLLTALSVLTVLFTIKDLIS